MNTIIALFSPPSMQRQFFDKTARFVNFKVPFEDILSPIIFEEIEEANERVTRPEFRVFPIKQGELYKEGCDLPDKAEQKISFTAKYEGDKWGGKYLRAPDIFFTILEKGKDKLKEIIQTGNQFLEIPEGFPKHHRIDKLWEKCREIIEKVYPEDPVDVLDAAEEYIHQFSQRDPTSMAFRYPTDKEGNRLLPGLRYINLRNLAEIMEKMNSLFEGVSDGISVYLENKREIEYYERE